MAQSKCAGCSHWHWCAYAQFPGDKSGFHYCDRYDTTYKRVYICGGKHNDHKNDKYRRKKL